MVYLVKVELEGLVDLVAEGACVVAIADGSLQTCLEQPKRVSSAIKKSPVLILFGFG